MTLDNSNRLIKIINSEIIKKFKKKYLLVKKNKYLFILFIFSFDAKNQNRDKNY